jgi:hypothetical protein
MGTLFAKRVEDELDLRLVWMILKELHSSLTSAQHWRHKHYSEVNLIDMLLST